MARLASVEKAGYYPTPPRIVDLIASMVQPNPGAVILDPCCGKGDALAALGKAWSATTVGNELSKERAAIAAEQCDRVTCGPIEFLQVDGQVSCLFLNPPYDLGESGQRLELQFLQYSNEWLAPQGWLIYVVPETLLTANQGDVIRYLCQWYSEFSTLRFPEPEYDRFEQVVLFARKPGGMSDYTWRAENRLKDALRHIPALSNMSHVPPMRSLPSANIPILTMSLPDADETLALSIEHGPMTTQYWENLTSPRGLAGSFQPVARPMPGHAAMLVMDGKVDGTEVEADDGCLLLKGTSIKVIKTEETSERDGDKVRMRKVERERVVTVINALNLDTGEFKSYNSQKKDEFEEFLTNHQDKLIGAVDKLYPALFVPNRDMPKWFRKLRHIHGPRPLPGSPLNGLLPKQAECGVALAMLLNKQKCGLLIGECGVGKTAISLALQGLANGGNFKIVVMAPGQTCEKWARESETVLQEFGLKAHIIEGGPGKTPISDITRAMEEPNPSLLVMSFQTAKNGPPWEAAFNVKKRRLTWTETETRRLDWYPYKEEVEVTKSATLPVVICPDCGEMLRRVGGKPWPTDREAAFWSKKQRFCTECGAPLWQTLPFKYGGRIAAAQFLNRCYAGRFSLIIDEAHNTKGRHTDVGQASMKLVSAASRVIGMTGTIYDGKASGIFAILYRFLPEFRALYDFANVQKFVEHHGLQETITTKTEKANSRYTSSWGYGRENVRVKEIPGVTPGIISWILRMSVFVRKEHVADALPEYTEYRVPVEPSKSQAEVIGDLNSAHGTAASKCRMGKMGLMSQWLYAACGALDYNEPDMIDDGEDSFGIGAATIEPGGMLPKDEKLIGLIKQELEQGRGVGVFFSQMNRRDWTGRIKKLLEGEGIYSEVLRADTCKKNNRESWYRKFVKRCRQRGQEPVLLMSGSLSYEGLDFIEMPTLIETGIDFQLVRMLQRDQRAHRITQDRKCKVFFLYYEGTFQETALSLVASKARAARKVEGKLIEGLAEMNAEEDLITALIKAAMSEEKPRAIDWGDMRVEDITPAQKLVKAAGPKKTLTVEALDVLASTSKREPAPIGDYQQLSLF